MWVDFRRYSSVYCDIVISQYCGIVALFVALLLSSHSGQILPPNAQILIGEDTFYFSLRSHLATKVFGMDDVPSWSMRQLFDFFACGNREGEPNVSLHHLFRRHFAGGGRRKKIPQKSFSASKVQIPLQRLSSSTLQHAANLQLCRIMFNLQIKTTLLQHALRVKAPHILGRSETRWHFLFYICNTPIRIMKFGIGGLGPNQICLFLDAVTSPAPSPMCI